ncbi:MAG: DUF479 domain-containing protein [Flavobacteriales bacterium]|nr:DUF479 domain-containing protein [Flavobacteriales bacterium]MCB9197441.1 DUF479 domain-containing protein [Flavobacteriales bacterium]
MNFLAHLYLSGSDDELKIGNFIADMVKGKEKENYSARIQEGIELHRKIDQYTDSHEQVKKAVELIKPNQGRYSPVVVDLMFDHYLAANWSKYHAQELNEYAQEVYRLMDSRLAILPDMFAYMLSRMKAQNWLYEYQHLDGIQQAFEGMSRRATFDSGMAKARYDLEERYQELGTCFELFFDDIVLFVKNEGVII